MAGQATPTPVEPGNSHPSAGKRSVTAAFLETLENSYTHPEAFSDRILPFLKEHPEECFPLLLRVFDSPNVVAKGLVAELIKGPLKGQAPELLLPELKDGNPERFAWAATILADLRHEAAVEPLIRALSERVGPIVNASLRALSVFGTPAAVKAMVEFFLTEPDEVKVSSSIRVLTVVKEQLVPEFLRRFDSLAQPKQAWVLKFLVETGDPSALAVFSATLQRDPLDLGLFCLKGLGRIGNAEAIAVLSARLGHGEWFLRKRVVEALGLAKVPEAVAPLIKSLQDPSEQVRAAAVESLSKVGHLAPESIIASLEQSMNEQAAGHIRELGLLKAMGQIKDRRFLEPMVVALADRTALFVGLDALGELGFPEAAPTLESFLRDEEWFNRLNALEALAKLHLPQIGTLAQKCLEDPNDMVRNAATRILSQTNHSQNKGT